MANRLSEDERLLEIPLDSLESGLSMAPVGEGRVRVGDLTGEPRPNSLRLSTETKTPVKEQARVLTECFNRKLLSIYVCTIFARKRQLQEFL